MIFLENISKLLWGVPTLVILFGTHIFLTLKTGVIQRRLPLALKLSFKRDKGGDGDISPFAALSTALAATLGTGNIVGVAAAVALGGAGAVFWCWVCGIFGMATNYGEALLSVKYRVKKDDGKMAGGPMYTLSRGLNMNGMAKLYCFLTILASFGIGNMVQANSISELMNDTFNIKPFVSGLVMTLLTALVILGGVKSIAKVCDKLVPFMALFYISGSIIILIYNGAYIIPAIRKILRSAFSFGAMTGGAAGAAIRYGVSRGLFTNEAGLGSAGIAAAAAKAKNPVSQALVSYTGTFWDTVVVCAMTGLVIVSGMLKSPVNTSGLSGALLTKEIFSAIPVIGPYILTIALLCFVYATILGWSYYGERAAEYLFGSKSILPYRILWIAAVMIGSNTAMPVVWNISDITNILMAFPNLLSLLFLSGVIGRETKKYFSGK